MIHFLCTLGHICSVMGMSKDVVQRLLQLGYCWVPSSVFTLLVGDPEKKKNNNPSLSGPLCSLT